MLRVSCSLHNLSHVRKKKLPVNIPAAILVWIMDILATLTYHVSQFWDEVGLCSPYLVEFAPTKLLNDKAIIMSLMIKYFIHVCVPSEQFDVYSFHHVNE